MADLNITASDVSVGSSVPTKTGNSAEAITAGELIREDSSGNIALAKNDSSANAQAIGVALNSAPGANQPITYVDQQDTEITISSVATVGEIYVVSANAGGIAPEGDLVSTNFVTVAFVATAANTLKMKILVSGVQVP